MSPRRKRIRFGRIYVDDLSFAEALDETVALVRRKKGGFIVTPNVDHVCLAEADEALCAAYADASLSLLDGTPLLWIARLLGHPVPEKISGSDFVEPLVHRAAQEGLSLYLFGAAPGIADEAGAILQARYPGLVLAGTQCPPVGFEKEPSTLRAALDEIAAAKPDLVLVALGCPKQEFFMHQNIDAIAPAVCLGIGATLDFIAGHVKRAPSVMSRFGLEWAYRLAQEPRRLAHRYLVRDRAILPITMRMMQQAEPARAFFVDAEDPGPETRAALLR